MPCSRKISKAFFIFSAQSTPRSLFRVVVVTITTYLVFTATFRNSNHAAVGGKCDTLLNLNGCRKHLRKKRHHRKDHRRKKHTNTSLSISNTNKKPPNLFERPPVGPNELAKSRVSRHKTPMTLEEMDLYKKLTNCSRPQFATRFNCQTGNVPQGFGSCFHVLSQRVADSIDKGATMHYSGKTIWSKKPLFGDYFDFPWCPGSLEPAEILDYADEGTYWSYDSPSVFMDFDSKQKFRRIFTGLMFRHIKPQILEDVDNWPYPSPDVVVHIRWGDKITSGESKNISIYKYIDAVSSFRPPQKANVFLMTVSTEAARLFIEHAPQSWNITIDPSLKYYQHHDDSKFGIANTLQETHGTLGIDLVKACLHASKANMYVLNTESNISRLLDEIRQTSRSTQITKRVDLASTDVSVAEYNHRHWRRLLSTPFR
eukprot:g1373.t1